MSKYTKKELTQIANLGCALCNILGYGQTISEIHHIRRLGSVRCDSPVIPLCLEHHRGASGVHGLGRKAFNSRYGLTEEDLLETTKKLLSKTR